ncbi:MAG: COX15/CtaA family protein, partial [Candidatus Lambdaproteobacteria bacterium]|nr:COX15/CtaA family protein [Candidatus Lambdaproteobacteria bacterium]
LAAGALVTSTGSSLAVPDWPLAYGQVFPPMVGGILYEHGHRLVASAVGLLTLVLAGWLLWAEPRRWVRWLGLWAVVAVIVQGVLGGLTVLFLLPKPISISHAVLGQLFFLLAVALVQVTSGQWGALLHPAEPRRPGRLGPLGMATFAAVLLELVLGATVRHHAAGLAIPDFPLAYGRLIPPLGAFPIAIHFAHRVGALVVLVLIAVQTVVVLRQHRVQAALRRPALAAALLTILQLVLGALVIWTQRAVPITTLHLVNGALLLAATGLLALRAVVLVPPWRSPGRLSAGAGVQGAGRS